MQSVNTLQIPAWILDLGAHGGAKQVCLSKTWAHWSEEWGSPWGQDRKTNPHCQHGFVSVWLQFHVNASPGAGAILQALQSPAMPGDLIHVWMRKIVHVFEASEDDQWRSSSIEWHLTALGVCHCRVLQHNRICFKLVSTGLASLRAC